MPAKRWSAQKNVRLGSVPLVLLLSGLIGFVTVAALLFKLGAGRIRQPLEFSHKIHADSGLECNDCHQNFRSHASSGRPRLEICSNCHSESQGKSEEEKKLQAFIQKGEEIAWQRLYHVPPDVYFSHRTHVVLGEIECQKCHGDIGSSSKSPSAAVKISMKKCMSCHKERQVTNDCIACHR
jgi:menaquinone reductase, multiheme cytochrome c subunit